MSESTQARARNLATIRDLFGTADGFGRAALEQIAAKYLVALLPDEAIAELAELHREEERRQARAAERRESSIAFPLGRKG